MSTADCECRVSGRAHELERIQFDSLHCAAHSGFGPGPLQAERHAFKSCTDRLTLLGEELAK